MPTRVIFTHGPARASTHLHYRKYSFLSEVEWTYLKLINIKINKTLPIGLIMLSPIVFKTRHVSRRMSNFRGLSSAKRVSVQESSPCEKDCKVLVNLVQEFGQETTFHGVNVMLAPGVGKLER